MAILLQYSFRRSQQIRHSVRAKNVEKCARAVCGKPLRPCFFLNLSAHDSVRFRQQNVTIFDDLNACFASVVSVLGMFSCVFVWVECIYGTPYIILTHTPPYILLYTPSAPHRKTFHLENRYLRFIQSRYKNSVKTILN